MKNLSVAITGGAGFIGAELANTLVKLGCQKPRLMDNLSTGDWSRLNFDTLTSTFDISTRDLSEIQNALIGVDTLFHLSAVKLHNERNSFDDLLLNNIVATDRLFEAAGNAGVKNVVFTSSLYAYGLAKDNVISEETLPTPSTHYGASKLLGENLLAIAAKKYGFRYAIARLFFIYGPLQFASGGYKSVILKNFERMKAGLPAIINGDGEQVLDYLYLEDCVNALIELGSNPPNDIVNVSSSVPISINSLIGQMAEITGERGTLLTSADWTKGTRRVGSNQKINSLVGWSPRITLEEGLQKTWESLN